jgi:PAS domain S-box-containing protein
MTTAQPESFFDRPFRSALAPIPRAWTTAVFVGLAYYLGARLGFELTLRPIPISTLWPPNTILLAALLLTPTSWWWILLLAALPAHLSAELNSGFPTILVLGWYVSNCSEALIGAALIRSLAPTKKHVRFDRSRDVGVFIFCAAFVATFFASFIDVGFVTLAGAGEDSYWSLWRTRFLSNSLTTLTIGSLVLSWAKRTTLSEIQAAHTKRFLEAVSLAAGLLTVSLYVFNGQHPGHNPSPVLLYAPLPFLLWSAIRFGPRGTTASLMAVTLLSIWGAVHGRGPFLTASPAENAFAIQSFLIVIAIPFLVMTAVIGEREHAERRSRVSEERLNLALEAADVGAWEWRAADDRVSWSEKSKELFGHQNPGEPTLAEFLSVVHPEDRPSLEETIYQSLAQGTSYEREFRVQRPDSSILWILGKGKALYNSNARPIRMIGVNVDITEHKLATKMRVDEVALRESEARLQELADAMPSIVWTATPDGRPDYINRQWYERTGADPASDKGDWYLMVHPDERQTVLAEWTRARATGTPYEIECRLSAPTPGEFRWYLLRALPIRDSDGVIVRWYGSGSDIHDQKEVEQDLRESRLELETRVAERTAELSGAIMQLLKEIEDRVTAEQALRLSEERFGKAFHGNPDASVITRLSDARIAEVNQKWEAMFGYTRAEAVGRTGTELGMIVHEEEAAARGLLLSGQILREYEVDLRTKSGKILRAALTTNTVDLAGEPCHIVVIRDVTERKRNESMLHEQQRELAHLSRVAALGELSGALAHELNQPLAAILTNARAAQRMIARNQPNAADLREILEDIAADDRRAGEVISRLRSFLRKSEIQPRPLRLSDIVSEVLSLVHSDLIQRRISVDSHVSRSLPRVMGDKVQLQQVLLNLILNASDAMAHMPPHDRRLTISADYNAAGAIELSVIDRGIGVDPDRLEQIFEPFVTTKETGLGLGLAICRSIVSAHGGRLWAVNNVDQGATFMLMMAPADSGITIPNSAEFPISAPNVTSSESL